MADVRIPPYRGVWETRLADGRRLRFRPVVATGRWAVDVYSIQGDVIYQGRPVAVGTDFYRIFAARFPGGSLTHTGVSDPTPDTPLRGRFVFDP